MLTDLGRARPARHLRPGAHGRLLWLANIALAMVALLPIWWWWSRTVMLPETDPLLERFHVGIFRDLLIDGGGAWPLTLGLIVVGLLVVALPVSVFLAGRDARGADHRGRPCHSFSASSAAARHFFWRFLRLTILGGVIMTHERRARRPSASTPWSSPLDRSNWPPGAFVALAIEGLAIGLVAMYFLLSFDYARIRLALTDRGGVLRAWLVVAGAGRATPGPDVRTRVRLRRAVRRRGGRRIPPRHRPARHAHHEPDPGRDRAAAALRPRPRLRFASVCSRAKWSCTNGSGRPPCRQDGSRRPPRRPRPPTQPIDLSLAQ